MAFCQSLNTTIGQKPTIINPAIFSLWYFPSIDSNFVRFENRLLKFHYTNKQDSFVIFVSRYTDKLEMP